MDIEINPYQVYNVDENDNIGVIVDCKNNETPVKDLDKHLGYYTSRMLSYHGFKNIVLFEDREEFEIAVHELRTRNIKRILYVFAGASVNYKAKELVSEAENLSAFVTNGKVMRKYFIFDLDQYEYFQIREDFLDNITHKLKSVSMENLGIFYLNPEDNNYRFLDELSNVKAPNIELLETDSEYDKFIAEAIIECTEDFLLNT